VAEVTAAAAREARTLIARWASVVSPMESAIRSLISR
jgi:hypothetical protein